MSLPCIKPMQPFHQALAPPPLVSSPPPHSVLPLARTVSSSSGYSASLTHRRRDEHPGPTGCQRRLSRHPPLGPPRSSFQHQQYLFSVCFPYRIRCPVICQSRRRVCLGCPQLPSLGWEFTSKMISASATTVNESDWFLSALRGSSPRSRGILLQDILVLLR